MQTFCQLMVLNGYDISARYFREYHYQIRPNAFDYYK